MFYWTFSCLVEHIYAGAFVVPYLANEAVLAMVKNGAH
jgi:hypothetical protein